MTLFLKYKKQVQKFRGFWCNTSLDVSLTCAVLWCLETGVAMPVHLAAGNEYLDSKMVHAKNDALQKKENKQAQQKEDQSFPRKTVVQLT